MKKYRPVLWVLCKCPACGHEQEAEAAHLAERGAKCEECGKATRAKIAMPDPFALPDDGLLCM